MIAVANLYTFDLLKYYPAYLVLVDERKQSQVPGSDVWSVCRIHILLSNGAFLEATCPVTVKACM